MSLLRRFRAELAGACRSVRYDLGRRPVAPPAQGPDMTSTGMNTFGGYVVDLDEPSRRPRRRTAAVTALGVLTVVGAAGAYLAVVNGLGQLMHETPASADTFPPQPAVTGTIAPVTGIGGGPAPRRQAPVAPRPAARATGAAAAPQAAPLPKKHNMSPVQTKNPANPVVYPPVPTPTVPDPTAPTEPAPSETPVPSASPEPRESDATPDETTDPTETPQGRHHRRHR